jgi:hypothetical protein
MRLKIGLAIGVVIGLVASGVLVAANFPLTVTDGTHTVNQVQKIIFANCTVSGSNAVATVTCSGSPSTNFLLINTGSRLLINTGSSFLIQ